MKKIVLFILMLSATAFGLDQAKPGELPAGHPPVMGTGAAAATAPSAGGLKIVGTADALPHGHPQMAPGARDRKMFEKELNVAKLKQLAVQHRDQVKVLDSWARQSLLTIRNKRALSGQEPVVTALDMCFRREAWHDENIIYVQAIPIRQQLAMLVEDPAERERIMTQGTVTPHFMEDRNTQMLLQRLGSDSVLVQSVNKVMAGYETLTRLIETLHVVPPTQHDAPWQHPNDLLGSATDLLAAAGIKDAPPLDKNYDAAVARQVVVAFMNLVAAWNQADAPAANKAIDELAAALPLLKQENYPSDFRRDLELWYTRTFNGTIVALVYGLATVLFLAVAVGGVKRVHKPALIIFALALLAHAAAMGVRWYLAGRIPIQNQFESVLGSALLGCLVGIALELKWRNGFMGLAFGFVGFLAMTCCFVAPFVAGKDMGASIGQVAGILSNTIWLYIHVNVVIFSYALIGASFLLGCVYLITKLWYWINPLEVAATAPMVEAVERGEISASGGPATIARRLESKLEENINTIARTRRAFLDQVDQLNMVILQMAFWTLGLGIILGAVWADVSWGRPWGWDPKETFALVTWIVYLILVHVRFVAPKTKGDWTAWLAVIGFFVMMFNWIGVNFFLAGLHSYA